MEEQDKLNKILSLVSDYIEDKKSKKEWKEGVDWVQYAGPRFDASEYCQAISSLLGGWLALADQGIRFERAFPKFLGKSHGTLTNSGSSANLLMLSALMSSKTYNLQKGAKVLTPVAGFPTTINPIIQLGFEPIFVDIDLPSLNMNLDQVEDIIKRENIQVIMFAHSLGNPPNMLRLMEIVKDNNIILLEDCCDALGSRYDNSPLGSFGEMASCSFYPAHHITMGEGGFVASQSVEQERIVRSFRDWGRGCYCVGQKATQLENGTCKKRFDTWLPSQQGVIFDHKYVYEEIGYNLKPIELQAAIGLEQIKKIDEITKFRKQNFARLYKIFEKYSDYFFLPSATLKSDPSWFAFPLTIKDSSRLPRDKFTRFLESHKIQTRTYFGGNILLQPAFSQFSTTSCPSLDFPNATKVTRDTFFLGTSPVVTVEQLDYIEKIVDKFFDNRLIVI